MTGYYDDEERRRRRRAKRMEEMRKKKATLKRPYFNMKPGKIPCGLAEKSRGLTRFS